MNTTVLRTAFQVTRAGVRALNDYRQRKAVEAYDALADAVSATNQFRSTLADTPELKHLCGPVLMPGVGAQGATA